MMQILNMNPPPPKKKDKIRHFSHKVAKFATKSTMMICKFSPTPKKLDFFLSNNLWLKAR
jgi:hypothetical protein